MPQMEYRNVLYQGIAHIRYECHREPRYTPTGAKVWAYFRGCTSERVRAAILLF